ncbi:MAG: hypothetical protein U0800_13525 [Isosphaeraceae bacterium]
MPIACYAAVTLSQAAINHLGIRAVTRLTDFSGWWILVVSAVLTASLLARTVVGPGPAVDVRELQRRGGQAGLARDDLDPRLFALGPLLPAYTITGFDASAHAAEVRRCTPRERPQGIVRSVLVSGLAGWAMLSAVVLAMPSVASAARGATGPPDGRSETLPTPGDGPDRRHHRRHIPCTATVTSPSRMAFAFARWRPARVVRSDGLLEVPHPRMPSGPWPSPACCSPCSHSGLRRSRRFARSCFTSPMVPTARWGS